MRKRTSLLLVVVAAVALIAVCATLRTAAAREPGSKRLDNYALGVDQVKQLLVLMDADNNGKVSKQEFMSYMDTEFGRLDKDENGQVDVTGAAPQAQPTYFNSVGK